MKRKFSPKARSKARQRVLQALYQWQLTGQDKDIEFILQQFLDEEDMRKVDSRRAIS
jgi:transcription termination factor NusB